MNLSFVAKIRLMIILLLIISFFQGIIIFSLLSNIPQNPATANLLMNIHNTIYIAWFLQLILSLITFFYLPIYLKSSFAPLHNKMKEIAKGKYDVDLNIDPLKSSSDKHFYALLVELRELLKSIKTFDMLKKEKIIEHHQRIKAILNLTKEGFIIMDKKGEIIYTNEKVTDIFPQLDEKVNIFDKNFPPEIENHIKKYMTGVLKTEKLIDLQQYFIPSLKRHISLNCAFIRDSQGKIKGAVFVFINLEKKKSE